MKNKLLLVFLMLFLSIQEGYSSSIECPKYCGGFHGGLTWLYLQPSSTDGDFEVGTLITLTGNPSNLSARLQELESDKRNSFRANIGYTYPCSGRSFDVEYFHCDTGDSLGFGPIDVTQLIQSSLGGSFTTVSSSGSQQINQIDFLLSQEYLIDKCFCLRPFVGVSLSCVNRKMAVGMDDFLFSNETSNVSSLQKSRYWGVGPLLGTHFTCPVASCFSFESRLGVGVLFGKVKSKLDADFVNGDNLTFFNARTSYNRISPILNAQLALVYQPKCRFDCYHMKLKLGYESDYYFKTVDRLDPFQGFVVNPNPHRVRTSSSIGLGGPFIAICLTPDESCAACAGGSCCPPSTCSCSLFDGVYGGVDFLWLKPISNNNDLVFGTLFSADGSRRPLKADLDHELCFNYRLGYQIGCKSNLELSYFHIDDSGSKDVSAGAGEYINSIDSSGNAFIQYSQASSKVHYDIDQVDLEAGKIFAPMCHLQCQFSVGVQYAHIKRKMENAYSDGTPDTQFQSKQAVLKSDFYGVGPLFGSKLEHQLGNRFSWKADCSLSMLVGQVKSRLDQQNQGTSGSSSNTLRTPWTDKVVPVVDIATSVSYGFCTPWVKEISFDVGYRYKNYFRSVNLVYPDFLTGLQQRNSDLSLHGPYISININNF